jgi:hypothetical protein
LVELAATAEKLADPSVASTVCNRAALIASDVGVPDVARAMCLRHARAYLDATPLPAAAAIRALEPVVNLARLQLRAGQADAARRHLQALFDAVTTGSPAEVEGVVVPANLVMNAADRRTVRAWLWGVLLADGTRALTAAGRWTEALAHVETHRGVGQRMLDGRQVAILAALTDGKYEEARSLLDRTTPGETWERDVTNYLTVVNLRMSGGSWQRPLHHLLTTCLGRQDQQGMAVFDTRLGLALLDIIDSPTDPMARLVVADLHRRTMASADGYAARETLEHPRFAALATDREAEECRALLGACALGAGALPADLHQSLTEAIRSSERTIRRSLA